MAPPKKKQNPATQIDYLFTSVIFKFDHLLKCDVWRVPSENVTTVYFDTQKYFWRDEREEFKLIIIVVVVVPNEDAQ